MKNILGAAALIAFGAMSLSSTVSASPAASLAGIGEQTPASVEQVRWNRHRPYHFFGGNYWHHQNYYYDGYSGGGYRNSSYYQWKRWCYSHPYAYKCKRFGWGY